MTNATDWDLYYRNSPWASRFTRPVLFGRLLALLQRYSVPNPSLAELGGAGSGVFNQVRLRLRPREYHVIDNNQYGLEQLRRRVGEQPGLTLWNRSVLKLDLPLELDTVFSLGLIEHFDEEGTREAIMAHLRLLKPGGIAIISFPTPTYLYRAARGIAEVTGKWIFHDERALWPDEVKKAINGQADWLHGELVWPIVFTQTLAAIRKRGAADSSPRAHGR
jgi:SAM-dependent methyltransferase